MWKLSSDAETLRTTRAESHEMFKVNDFSPVTERLKDREKCVWSCSGRGEGGEELRFVWIQLKTFAEIALHPVSELFYFLRETKNVSR